jgi:hypothetical protein
VTRCSMAFQSRVQRYLRHTGIIGKPFVRTIHFSQREKMLLASGQPWIPLKAQQWYTVQPPGLSPAVRWAFEDSWCLVAGWDCGDGFSIAGWVDLRHGSFGQVAGVGGCHSLCMTAKMAPTRRMTAGPQQLARRRAVGPVSRVADRAQPWLGDGVHCSTPLW